MKGIAKEEQRPVQRAYTILVCDVSILECILRHPAAAGAFRTTRVFKDNPTSMVKADVVSTTH